MSWAQGLTPSVHSCVHVSKSLNPSEWQYLYQGTQAIELDVL